MKAAPPASPDLPAAGDAPPPVHPRREEVDGRYLGGFILIALGIVFLIDELGGLPGDEWPFILIAIGAAFMGDAAFRATRGASGHRVRQRAVTGLVLLGVGVLFWVGFDLLWPAALILAGVLILVNAARGRT